ncbi:aminotransferase class I/II-fold pyridoxal phosphate-dependent enzyme [Bacillus sp. ISL-47]|uniref:threonine aldolase family protein n=1 Tax=Bacillus sp. ISL-47 TaxID=2819130 RepID=UPI001BEC3394|nr:aminotransferase class I/II-fold pyridoxal phosphate-dependent enzyme [Bacillus sp. ISL-47]MBT2686632.1 aminotransferase class I/II-fold pyridoxal phosphate-dependent enzyme [Bacillus sp. ISL-47]MBT2707024.1 aminotransferase class I/II-fold pyridoxal phosphate-dependent enzyme [Pseudomonas sp. ISL-84]
MTSTKLFMSFKETNYQLAGHGTRNVGVLKTAFRDIEENLESDLYGEGKVIEEFQKKMAVLLGKESAVFFPSGTMAQQIALRIWCDEMGAAKVAYHPLSHLEIHEEDGLKKLHNIETILLADKTRVIELKDVEEMGENIACLLLELPQREIGGHLPSFETLEQISKLCREKGIKLHLDGARLLEVLPYYQKTAAEISALFDSVYMSFYKGVGGIAGAILAGNKDFIGQSKIWKRRYGGDLISLYPYILSADYYYEKRKNKMGQYYEAAKELAKLYNSCHDITTLPMIPVSNMFHVHFHHPKEKVEDALIQIHERTGVGISGYLREIDEHTCYFEVSLGDLYENVPKEMLNTLFQQLDEVMKQL